MRYDRKAILSGLAIYSIGDTIAACITGEFSFYRVTGMMALGGTLYALEIPNYFGWIDRKVPLTPSISTSLKRTGLALLYFNPLWIARHLAFIALFSGSFSAIDWSLLEIGLKAWWVNIPIATVANFIIQVKLPFKWRFAGSAVFSALMAVYYALAGVLFD